MTIDATVTYSFDSLDKSACALVMRDGDQIYMDVIMSPSVVISGDNAGWGHAEIRRMGKLLIKLADQAEVYNRSGFCDDD